ncbi:MAG: AbrB/MazE/SpoVT family DNA-binding domain-containing protein [Gammaproteobacteria bacterium]|nr:AbrB/MazE/SpoVT family DNA-binding domain-containing protein [Gammaproteobacteria bacterium]
MSEATVTSKRQITIPSAIRKAMRLHPKDRVVFTIMPDGTTVMRAKSKSIAELKGAIDSNGKSVPISSMRMK